MLARIFQPARNAMQSGKARTKRWVLEFEPERASQIEPLMGWTASSDMRQQVSLDFDTLDEAIAYAPAGRIVFRDGRVVARTETTTTFTDPAQPRHAAVRREDPR